MGRGKHSFLNDGDEHVGADLPAKPLSSVWSRQHGVDFPDLPASLLASTSLQSRCPPSGHANTIRIISICQPPRMKEPASGQQSLLDDEKEHVRLNQPGWHERRIRDVSPGGSLITCSSRLIVKLLLTGAGLNPEKK